jgi:ABC transport system ATP-binding/permease protein
MANDSIPITNNNLELIYNEIVKENNSILAKNHKILFDKVDKINPNDFNMEIANEILVYLNKLQEYYRLNFNNINENIDQRIGQLVSTPEKREEYQKLYDENFNTYLSRFARNSMAPLPLVRLGNRLVQKIDPIYLDPQDRRVTSFRTHFLSPNKNLFGNLIPTFYFNVMVIWIFTLLAYVALYYNGLSKLLASLEVLGGKVSQMKIPFARKKSVEETELLDEPDNSKN